MLCRDGAGIMRSAHERAAVVELEVRGACSHVAVQSLLCVCRAGGAVLWFSRRRSPPTSSPGLVSVLEHLEQIAVWARNRCLGG